LKKLNGLDKYVIFSITILLLFCVAEMVVSSFTGLTHDTLTSCVYAAFGGEILSCALIKIFKLKGDKNETEIEQP
jgi:hypothetical protein